MCRTTKKGSVSIYFDSRRSFGSTSQPCSTARKTEVKAYMLRKLKTGFGKGHDSFVTVDEVASAEMKELEDVYPVLNVDKAKDADEAFRRFIQSVFEKRLVSSVFLTGDGFENNWYPNSLRTLCNGRRAFQGNNLYSKGACYAAYNKAVEHQDIPVYLDETKMTEQICLKLRVRGVEEWYPIVAWGTRWYEGIGSLKSFWKTQRILNFMWNLWKNVRWK